MKKNNRYPQGLTLMELLVVVIIIMLVMSIGSNTYRNQRKHVIYNDSVLKVANLIKAARNYAVTSRSVYDSCEIDEADRVYVPEEGYGVYIKHSAVPGESRVVLFANTKTDTNIEKNQYDQLAAVCDSDLIEEEFMIPVDAEFIGLFTDKLLPAHTPVPDDEVVIIFRPPLADATVLINNHPPVGSLTYLNDLYLHFRRPESASSVPSQYIHFNHIGGFPEILTE